MYAISFSLNHDILIKTYQSETYIDAYSDIRKILKSYNFDDKGSIYFGDSTVNAIDCVIAVQDLINLYPWFCASVQDIKMFRVEEITDLRKVIDKELSKKK